MKSGARCALVLAIVVGCGGAPARHARRAEPAPAAPPAPPPSAPAPPGPSAPSGPSAPAPAGAGGNHGIRDFDEAKKELTKLYTESDAKIDLYCGCSFMPVPGHGFKVDLASCGYAVVHDAERAGRIEWEHAVAAAHFGHTFAEWRDGSPACVEKGKPYKGRKCARVASPEFARMEADMHNLFPVVGEVNALRGDLPMGVMDPPERGRHVGAETVRFGKCGSTIESGVFMPRREARGDLARAAKYMDLAYPDRHLLDDAHRAVFDRWDAEDPPDAWERARNEKIAARQGNANPFIGRPAAR